MTSKTTVLAVVVGLIVLGLVMTVGAFCLMMTDRAVPGEMWTVLGAVLGGLTGMLVSTRSTVGEGEIDPTAAKPLQVPQVGAPK